MDQTIPSGEKTAEGGKGASDDLLTRAKADFEIAEQLWAENRKRYLIAAKFRLGRGNQWPEKLKKDREAEDKPCLEVDKLNQYVRQVVNDGRQNRPAVKVRPNDEGGDEKIAEAFQGIIRSINNRSNLDEALDTALDHAATGGFGFFRVLTEYAHEKTFNQEIVIRRVRNPLSVMLGPHYLADGSDAPFGFFIDEVPKKVFAKKWPKAKVTDWENDAFVGEWISEHNVRVCEYFYKVEELQKLHLLADGTTSSAEDYERAVAELGQASVPPIEETREIPTCTVKWCRLTAAEVLEENKWLGKYIPIVPVYGNEMDIEGKVIYTGLIEGAMDAQRLHNYMRSKFAERVALTPMAPWLIEEGQAEGREDEWKAANSGGLAALTYKASSIDGHPVPPPSRVSPTDIPAGFAQDMQMSEHDIQASMGMYAASIGEKSNEKSGRAIMARQREGDTGTFHYQDNLNRAVHYLGRIEVDLIPKVYDSKRVVRILGEDGTLTEAEVDPEQDEGVQKVGSKMIYNLNVGTYDVTVEAGPSYTTKRQEAAEGMTMLVQADPSLMQTHGDLVAKVQDWPMADEWAERSKILLPPPVQEAMRAKEGGEDPKVAAVMAQMSKLQQDAEQAIAERDQALQQATQELSALKADKEAAGLKAQADLYNAETERMKVEAEIGRPEAIEQPIDNTVELAKMDLERERLQKEDDWKKLEAETRVIVAQIGAESKAASDAVHAETAAANAMKGPNGEAMEGAEGEKPGEPAEPAIDMNAALVTALQGFQEAVQEMKRPRKVVRDRNGMIAGVE